MKRQVSYLIAGVLFFCLNFSFAEQVVPWPLSFTAITVDFSWNGVEGLWEAKSEEFHSYFNFRVVVDKADSRLLIVEEIDLQTEEILSIGIGYEENQVVRSLQIGNAIRYELFVRFLEDETIKEGESERFLALSIRPYREKDWDFHVKVNRLLTTPLCINK